MSITKSMFNGISGMRNLSQSLDVISNNIANVSTIGYKAQRMTFADALSQTMKYATGPSGASGGTNPVQIGLGSQIGSVSTIFSQGTVEKSGVFSDLSLDGDGFFMVKKDSTNYYTRNGQFVLDAQGQLVNASSGAVLQGYLADTQGNILKGTGTKNIVVPINDKSVAKQTAKITFVGNLNSSAKVYDPNNANDPNIITSNVSIYDSQGNRHLVTIKYGKTQNNTWDWKANTDVTNQDGTTSTVEVGNGSITFKSDGSFDSATNQSITINTTNGSNQDITINLDFGTQGGFLGMTQTENPNTLTSQQDGYTAGDLVSLSIDKVGKVIGSFSNGQFKTLGQLAFVKFRNNAGLERTGESLYNQTINSGDPMVTTLEEGASTKIVSGGLESSTVDLTEEFAKMIITQRGYQANARIITTADEMTTELIGLKR
jgi:flagellar hook protein FlgE